jgi:hypothetical protein
MMKVALDPAPLFGHGPSKRRAAVAFSKAAAAAFHLSLVITVDERWDIAANELHVALQEALDPKRSKDPKDFNYGWMFYSHMGLMLKDLLPDRLNHNGTNSHFRILAAEAEEFNRSRLRKILNRWSPPKTTWKRDPETFLRLAQTYRRISNKASSGLSKRTRDEGRPSNPERANLLKWVQAQELAVEELSPQLKEWSRLLVVLGAWRDDMPPLADSRSSDGAWLYRTEADYADAFTKWWNRQTEAKYKRLRDILKNTEKHLKRAEQRRRDSQRGKSRPPSST